MIKITRNPNFTEWLNISLAGKLIDNAKTMASAMRIAKNIQQKEGVKFIYVSR
jgi:hypothetical protein